MPVDITARGFEADGVRLLSAADAGFAAHVEELAAPGWARTILDASPAVVIISNQTAATIVAASTTFALFSGGSRESHCVFYVAPDVIVSSGLNFGRASEPGILPGHRKMLGFDFAVPDRAYGRSFTREESEFYDPQVRNWILSCASGLASASSIQVWLNAVIFEDGRLIGEPSSRIAGHFSALVRARQDAYREVIRSIEAGEPKEEVLMRISRANDRTSSDELDTEWLVANEAINTVVTLLENHPDEPPADVLRRALLPAPFVVHHGRNERT